ncbi:MAG: transporter substrate-binding domain-containing protein [Rhodoferax sp.]|nr:transporter substrate-binding domain-containing protein [Rhodoferax sp.]
MQYATVRWLSRIVLCSTTCFVAATGKANAGCSRPIAIAASPMGRAMVIEKDVHVTGYTRDIVDRVSRETGCTFKFYVVPRPRAFLMLRTGEVDIVTDATLTDDRLQHARFVELGTIGVGLVSLARKPVPRLSMAAIRESQITLIGINGHDYGSEYQQLVSHAKADGRISLPTSPEHAMKMLLAGRAQAILTAPFTLIEAWQQFGEGEKLVVSEIQGMPVTKYGWYFSNAKMNKVDIATIADKVVALTQSGEVRKLSYYHYPDWFTASFRATQRVDATTEKKN